MGSRWRRMWDGWVQSWQWRHAGYGCVSLSVGRPEEGFTAPSTTFLFASPSSIRLPFSRALLFVRLMAHLHAQFSHSANRSLIHPLPLFAFYLPTRVFYTIARDITNSEKPKTSNGMLSCQTVIPCNVGWVFFWINLTRCNFAWWNGFRTLFVYKLCALNLIW